MAATRVGSWTDWSFSALKELPDPGSGPERSVASGCSSQCSHCLDLIQALATRLLVAEQAAFRRVARSLHDEVAQPLILARNKVGSLFHSASPLDQADPQVLQLLDQAIRATRSVSFDVGTTLLYDVGLDAALRLLGETFQQRYKIRCRHESDAEVPELDDSVRTVIYRSVRELLQNVLMYSATEVRLSLRNSSSGICIAVQDNGSGVRSNGSQFPGQETCSMVSIATGVANIGGHLTVAPQSGRGTTVTMIVPLPEPASGIA